MARRPASQTAESATLPAPAGPAGEIAFQGGPEQVLAYLSRYTHRVAIANGRLLSLADGKVRAGLGNLYRTIGGVSA